MGKPKIRFKGYNDEWEQRKLGNVLKFQNGFNGSKERYGTGTKLISVMDILNDDFITYESIRGLADVTEEEKERFSVDFGDVLFQRSSENVEDAGRTNVYLDRKRAVFGGFVIRGKKNSDYQPEFMRYVLDTKMIRKQITTKAQGAQHINVSQETLQDVLFCLPSKEEQIRIGNYFRNLDNLITLHQRKYDEMKTLKKYMLQKMFPQNGPKIPKIRFEGFTGEWEQRKLGEVAQEFKSGNFLKADEIDIAGDYPVYGGNGLRGYTSTYNHDGEFALIGRQGALCGNMNYSVGKAYFTEHAVVVEADENNDTRFLYCMLDIMNLGQYSDQSAQPGLAVNKLIKLENFFPQKEEQQQIGWYFNTLDRLITLHQRKCNELKNIKKFMLQSMFV